MLRPAYVADLSVLRSLIRDGAVRGDIDRELATPSPKATIFFETLRKALASGYFVEEHPLTGASLTVAAPAYLYRPEGIPTEKPIGFGIFKALTTGYQLWLAGLATAWRGQGYGRAMITALLNSPHGKQTYLIRLLAGGTDNEPMGHLLESLGYKLAQKTSQHLSYVRNDTPDDLLEILLAPASRLKRG